MTMRGKGSAAVRLLAAIAVLLGALTFVSRPIDAYTPSTFPADAGTKPTATVKVTHSQLGTPARDPKQGETFAYTMDFELANMVEPGVTRSTTLTVYADPNAPFAALPATGDFSYQPGGGPVAGTRGACSTTSCTFTITGIPNSATIRFTKSATVKSPLPDGTLIMASANVDVKSTPTYVLENVSATAPKACSGTYTFEQKVGAAGAWWWTSSSPTSTATARSS